MRQGLAEPAKETGKSEKALCNCLGFFVGLRAVYGFMKQSLRVVVYKHEGKAEARCLPRPGLELSLSCVAP